MKITTTFISYVSKNDRNIKYISMFIQQKNSRLSVIKG